MTWNRARRGLLTQNVGGRFFDAAHDLYYQRFGDLEPGSEGDEPAACFDSWLAAFRIIEMLFDSLFSTEPQNDLPPEKTERNTEIGTHYEQGDLVSELTPEFGISELPESALEGPSKLPTNRRMLSPT